MKFQKKMILITLFLFVLSQGVLSGAQTKKQKTSGGKTKKSELTPVKATPDHVTKATYDKILSENENLRRALVKKEKQEHDINDLLNHLKEVEKERDALAESYKGLTGQLAQIGKLEASFEETKNMAGKLNVENAELQKQLHDANQKLANMDNLIAQEVDAKLKKLKGEKTALIRRLEEDKMDTIEATNNEREKEAKKYLTESMTAEANRLITVRLNKDLTLQTDKLNSEIIKLTEENTAFKKKFTELSSELSAIKAKDDKLREDMKKMGEQAQLSYKLSVENTKLKKDNDDLSLKNKNLILDATNSHYNMGLLLDEGGKAKDAEKEYLKAVTLNPDDAGVHYNLGVLYDEVLKDEKSALIHYKRYLELKPDAKDADDVKKWIKELEKKK